jgi:hypothetical protein
MVQVPAYINEKIWMEVIELMASNGANLSRVVFFGSSISTSRIDILILTLNSSTAFLGIDSFGNVNFPSIGPIPPNDDEIVNVVKSLCDLGFSSRLIISPNIKSKLSLVRYGGPGLYHIIESIVPRLLAIGLSFDCVDEMIYRNGIQLIRWYVAPKPVEATIDMQNCYICDKLFPLHEQYSKFSYTYCSSACLNVHRKREWKQN